MVRATHDDGALEVTQPGGNFSICRRETPVCSDRLRMSVPLSVIFEAAAHSGEEAHSVMSKERKTEWGLVASRAIGILVLVAGILLAAGLCTASPGSDNQVPSIFDPHSPNAKSLYQLSTFVLAITGIIFVVVFSLLAYVIVKFRDRTIDAWREPAQVYGSTQIELAWTVIPILIVVVLFLTTARVIHAIQDAPKPAQALSVTVIGHQFWWEFRYPELGIVTANELHLPVSTAHLLETAFRRHRPQLLDSSALGEDRPDSESHE